MPPDALTAAQQKELEEKLSKMSPEELREWQRQQCIFCRIAAGKVSAQKVYEDKAVLAILDIYPAQVGHVLVLPKEHYAVLPQIPANDLIRLSTVCKQLSNALLRGLRVEGTSLFMANGIAAGQKSSHFVVHLIPRKTGDELLELLPRKLDPEKIRGLYPSLVNTLSRQLGLKKEVIPIAPEKEPVGATSFASDKPLPSDKLSVLKRLEESEAPSEPDESVSLDDIARLFG